ncbi:hypothetical protein QA639_28675 [Bradyrhizobium pachyrhizi]|uniref:hypothetical protein n=1 Tax=Bradyrhizobium pachyrhizi TaxID=280333 RepID=UPI0024B0DE43|nr:hypothetical protein [Bradyrhizobium pachyrhizi]WFU53616.1 hypothetical protein QA639_28675 [Bradyrhizobium pachyrhizi]
MTDNSPRDIGARIGHPFGIDLDDDRRHSAFADQLDKVSDRDARLRGRGLCKEVSRLAIATDDLAMRDQAAFPIDENHDVPNDQRRSGSDERKCLGFGAHNACPSFGVEEARLPIAIDIRSKSFTVPRAKLRRSHKRAVCGFASALPSGYGLRC